MTLKFNPDNDGLLKVFRGYQEEALRFVFVVLVLDLSDDLAAFEKLEVAKLRKVDMAPFNFDALWKTKPVSVAPLFEFRRALLFKAVVDGTREVLESLLQDL